MTQTWVDFEQNVIEAAIDQWRDSLRSHMRAGGRHFEHMLQNYCLLVLCDSSEHFMKLSISLLRFFMAHGIYVEAHEVRSKILIGVMFYFDVLWKGTLLAYFASINPFLAM